jgi:hypothetical protein
MVDDPNLVVFSRPTPGSDRIAFGICGAGMLAPLLWARSLGSLSLAHINQMGYFAFGLLAAWVMAGVSLLAVALWGGAITVTIDRKARELREVAKLGPLTAFSKSAAFKDLGQPMIYPERGRQFIVEIPVKDRVAVRIGAYRSRAEAEAVLQTAVAALDVAEPLAEPVSPAALNALKSGSLAMKGPLGPGGF